ncbi:MAG: hypothetical protein GKR87_07530 [Kiritimatiellae bacterium]|nr:hypothetical protein [Kiritimatiellia bacterium]
MFDRTSCGMPSKQLVKMWRKLISDRGSKKIKCVLQQCGGNKSQAERILGSTRGRLYSRMKVLDMADG